MSSAESDAAKAYWKVNHVQSTRVLREGHEYRWVMAERIAALKPSSVLEFGCGSGRNLAVLRSYLPDARIVGIDMSALAIENAVEAFPDVEWVLGDESALTGIEKGAFDVVFCVSVLDHIPEPEWRGVYADLVRVASNRLLLAEPWLDDRDFEMAEENIEAVPHTYCHSYLANDPKLKKVARMPMQAALPSWERFAGLYWIMERRC
jgi:trans-aconitate methyltransferase